MAFVVTWEPDYTKNPSKAPGFLKKVPIFGYSRCLSVTSRGLHEAGGDPNLGSRRRRPVSLGVVAQRI